jgi:imidazolonepropionase-like amidohydrolase
MWWLLACADKAPSPALPEGLLIFDRVTVVDADGRRPDRAVLVLDGRIYGVEEAGQRWPAEAEVVEGRDRSLVPGLVDSHVHLATPGTLEPVGDMLEVNLRAQLGAGVTEVVDLGGPLSILALRDAIARGEAVGPRIHASGPFLTAVGSHPCETFPDPALCTFVEGAQAGQAATQRAEAGADLLKVALADASFTPWGATPRLDLEALAAVVAVGLPVWAHVDEDEDVIDAVEQGVSVLAHPAFAAPMGEEALAAAARARGLTSTLSAFTNPARLAELEAAHPAIEDSWRGSDPEQIAPGFAEESAEWAAQARANLQTLRAAGARVLPGSDAGYYFVPHGTGLHDELEAMVELGWSPLEALGAATADAREVLGAEGGRVEAGAPADLVLLEGDPSEDIAALRQVEQVWLSGQAWEPEADLLPGRAVGVCLEEADCAEDEACAALTHECAPACPEPYALDSHCGAEAWCAPADGLASSSAGVCLTEPPCDLYAQGCAPDYYNLACLPYDLDTNACWISGPQQVGQTCSWTEAAQACAPGLFCSWLDSRCYELCDPKAPPSCSSGACVQQSGPGGEPWFGVCL